jgi:hypothetical protein
VFPASQNAANLLSIDKVWQSPKTGSVAIMFRAKYTGAPSSNIAYVGIAGTSIGLTIQARSGQDATHWTLFIDGAGETTVTLSIADTLWHNFGITYDSTAPTPTVTVWIDGVSVGSTTTVTNVPTASCSPGFFQQTTGQIAVSKALWGYVAP